MKNRKKTFRSKTYSFWLPVIILFAGTTHIGLAQESESKIPELNDHVFTYISNFKSPFTNTSFTTNLGIGSASNLSYEIGDINGQPIVGINGNLLFANLSFDYQQRIREWIALYLHGGLTARLGTDVFSLLSQGVNTVTSFEIGWLVRIAEGEKYALSGTIGLSNLSGTFINIRRFVDDIVNNIPNPSITKSVPVILGEAGLQFAYGFTQVTALSLEGQLGLGESFDRTDSDLRYALKGSLDFNFKRKYNVPLGLILGYSLVSQPQLVYINKGTAHLGTIKLAYTGTKDFLIGIETTMMNIPLEDVDQKSRFLVNLLSIRYYFN